MAAVVTGATLDEIYERISGADTYHPFEANTFADWAIEAGDIVTLKRGENEYTSPVQNTRMTWKGAVTSMVMNSTGSKDREAVAKISRQKYGRGGAALRSEIKIFKEFTSSDGMLYSAIYMSESRLVTQFDNAISDVHSTIQQTAENISSAVYAANSTLYSYIDQTATSIRSTVSDMNEDLHSEIEQTKSMIRSAVWTANSLVYSYVDQTASYILEHVGERSGSKIIPSMTAPEDTPENPLNVGDMWVEGTMFNYWDDMEGEAWIDYDPTHPEYDWSQLKGQKLYEWKDGKWNLVLDETVLAEDTDLLRTKEQISMIAYNQDYLNGQFRSNLARLDVRADQITANVEERVQQIGSNITQTATSIRAYVVDEINDVGSEIIQTASQIRSEVHASASTLYSYIDQTATYIRQEVANKESQLRASITTESNRISLVVEGTGSNAKIKPASIVQSINNGSSSIVISANHINLDGYVKATDLTTDWLKTKIESADLITAKSLQIYNGTTPYGTANVQNIRSLLNSYKVVQDGNNFKLQYKPLNSNSWVDVPDSVTFSRATSLSGEWSGGAYKVTASPQGNTISVSPFVQHIVPQGQPGTSMNSYVATGKETAPYYDTHGNSKPLYLIKDSGYVKIRDVNSASGGNTYAQIQAGCSDISLDGWTDRYSGDSNRYTILSGSGANAVLAMSFKVKSNDGYEEEMVWANSDGSGANKAITMAYRNGFAAGGGGVVPSYSVSFNSTGTFSSGTSPSEALSGWNPKQISGVPNSQNQTYRYIKFTIDGKKRSFYFT